MSSADWSGYWDRCQFKSSYSSAVVPRGESFLLLQIAHEQAARPMIEADVIYGQHAHTEADLCADRVERRVERFLGDGEVGEAHRQDPRSAENEERESALHRYDL